MQLIKSDGKHVIVTGNPVELVQDFVNIVSSMRGVFTEHIGAESADEIISLCGMYAYAHDDKEEEMYAERLAEVMCSAKEQAEIS